MSSKPNKSLKPLHTFGTYAYANEIVSASTADELIQLWQQANNAKLPILLLGGGSNVLFTADFSGQIILNRIMGKSIHEDDEYWYVHVGAGENWHHLIEYLIENEIYGLENLALIPGCAGTAPIQNIGAYGMEFKDICDYVDLLSFEDNQIIRLSAAECAFGYRDSLFKQHKYQNNHAIISVGLKINKKWQPKLSYGDLKQLDSQTVTPKLVFETVCTMRMNKLPDPNVTGNAGSFFKNPIVNNEIAEKLKQQYPNCPQYPFDGQTKLAAGWLIDQCELKGYHIGGAAVHDKQALVLINANQATGQDIVALAAYVRQKVAERFQVWLEPEVRFIGINGEISAVEAIS